MKSISFTYNLLGNQNSIIADNLFKPNFRYDGGSGTRFQDLAIPSFLMSYDDILSKYDNVLPKYDDNHNEDIGVLSDESFERLFDMVSKQMKPKTNTTRSAKPRKNHRKTKKH